MSYTSTTNVERVSAIAIGVLAGGGLRGVGRLTLHGAALEWRQVWRPFFSVFGLLPRWAPNTVDVPFNEIRLIRLEQKALAPEILRIDTDREVFRFKLGVFNGMGANRKVAHAIHGLAPHALAEIPARPVAASLLRGVAIMVLTACTLWITAFVGAAEPAMIFPVLLTTGVLTLAAYS